MTIDDAGWVSCASAIIAQNESTFGEVLVRGPGSYWQVDGSLDVGMTGLGTLTIEDGGHLQTAAFATVGTFPEDVPFGDLAGVGDVRVSGSGSLWAVEGDLHVGYLSAGRWTLGTGGRVTVGGDLFRGPWLPDDPQPQTIIELGSAGDYAQAAIEVAGSTEGFDARVELVGGYAPAPGDDFRIVTAASGAGSFTFDLPALPPGLFWHELIDLGSARLRVGPVDGDVDGDGLVSIEDLLATLAA